MARAELAVVKAPPKKRDVEAQALTAAKKKRAAAAAAAEKPGRAYTSLRPSLKALEGPDETDASRRRPYPRQSTGRRSALARWITHADNPLTARVAVNQIWLRHFGRPLVASVTDFGRRTEAPPLQDVLDYLAAEMIEGDAGWEMKRLHRMIVLSEAYQRSSRAADADERTRVADPDSQFYWRRAPRRMEAQVVRDSLLSLSGQLAQQLGGPTVDPAKPAKVARRSLYFAHSRDDQHKILAMFDDADILACYRRQASIVPQQALTLANSRESMEAARQLNHRLAREYGALPARDFVPVAFETILARAPTPEEVSICLGALEQLGEPGGIQSGGVEPGSARNDDPRLAQPQRFRDHSADRASSIFDFFWLARQTFLLRFP